MNSEVLDGTGVSGVVSAVERRFRVEIVPVTVSGGEFSARCRELHRIHATTLASLGAVRWRGTEVALYIEDKDGAALTMEGPFGRSYEEVRHFVPDVRFPVVVVGGDRSAYLATSARMVDVLRGLSALAAPEELNRIHDIGLPENGMRSVQWLVGGASLNVGGGRTPVGWGVEKQELFFVDRTGTLTVIGRRKLQNPRELQSPGASFTALFGSSGVPEGAKDIAWEIIPSSRKRLTALQARYTHKGMTRSHTVFCDGIMLSGAPQPPQLTAAPPKGSARRGGARTSDRPPTAA